MKARQITKYEDIINLPHHKSAKHPPMPMEKRAAQFSPFAALTGYEEAVRESARITSAPPKLADDEQERLDRELQQIMADPGCPVALTYFIPDTQKKGGHYHTETTSIKKLNAAGQEVLLSDGTRLPCAFIVEIHKLQR